MDAREHGPLLSNGGLDRAGHRRTEQEWLDEAWTKARILVVDEGRALIRDDALVFLDAAQAPEGERYFLGVDTDDVPYFAVAAETSEIPGAKKRDLRGAGLQLSAQDAGILATAVGLANWHVRHPYSPLTGQPTVPGEAGWTRTSDDGSETFWPRTDPAVIMVVHDGVAGPEGRCLLGHNAAWNQAGWENRYSCLAGFVEPGESAEMSVAREVFEEVGIVVRDVTYVSSQPWPFPGSIMLGFHAVADPNAELTFDETEISHARWFTRAEVRAVLAGEPADFGLPTPISIAHHLVETWAGQD